MLGCLGATSFKLQCGRYERDRSRHQLGEDAPILTLFLGSLGKTEGVGRASQGIVGRGRDRERYVTHLHWWEPRRSSHTHSCLTRLAWVKVVPSGDAEITKLGVGGTAAEIECQHSHVQRLNQLHRERAGGN